MMSAVLACALFCRKTQNKAKSEGEILFDKM